MSNSDVNIDSIVHQAQGLGPRERAVFIRKACGADETLLSQVLIALHEDNASGKRVGDFALNHYFEIDNDN